MPKCKVISFSETKPYMNLLQFFKRQKLENPGSLALLYFEIFVNSKKSTDYHAIRSDDLKMKKIIPSKQFLNYSEWRTSMINRGIIICMADHEEFKENNANYKACMFKFGPTIKKYIEAAVYEKSSLLERLDTKADSERVDKLENDVAALNIKVEQMIELLLEAMPPDTPVRKEIARKLYSNKKECIAALNEEKEFYKKIYKEEYLF